MKNITYSLFFIFALAMAVAGESLRLDPLVRQTQRAIPFCVTGAGGNSLDDTIAKVVRQDLSKHGAFVAAGMLKYSEK